MAAQRQVEEALESVYFVESALFVVERIIIALFALVYPNVNRTAFFFLLCFSSILYILSFKERNVIVSKTSLQRRDYAHRSFKNSYVFCLERAAIIILAFHKMNPYNTYIVVGLFAISNTLYILQKLDYSLLPLLENVENEEVGNGSRVMKEVEGDYNDHEVEKAELCSFEKFLLWFQGLAFFLLLSSSPFVSILHYPFLFSNLLVTLCYGVRQMLLYPLPNYYSYVFWLERLETVILLIYNQFGITSFKVLPFSLLVLSKSLHIIINYMPCIFEQKVKKISSHDSSGTPSTPQPKESGKEHSETDHAKDQADVDVIINNVLESNQSDDDGVVDSEIVEDVAEMTVTANENGNADIGDHLKREMDFQLVPLHEEEEEDDDDDDYSDDDDDYSDDDDDSEDDDDDASSDGGDDDEEEEDGEDDDVNSWEELKTNLMAELKSANVAAAAKEEAKSKSDEEEEDRRVVVTHNHEEDDEKCKREMTEAAVALVEYKLKRRRVPAEQYYEKYIKQLLNYISWCEEAKKDLNEKLNLSKEASEEQSQKWEEERKELVSKLNNATSLLEHHKDTVDAFNRDRCKWEEEKAKLQSDMEELTSQSEENALSLMNRYEDLCRDSKDDMQLLSAKLRAAEESSKYYQGMLHESENLRLKLVEHNNELAAKLQDATLDADLYYTLFYEFDERCRSWQEAYYYIYYNYYYNSNTSAV